MTDLDPNIEHCHGQCSSTYDEDTGDLIDEGDDCDHCECCCPCLGCEYGPRDGMLLTAEQRAPIEAFIRQAPAVAEPVVDCEDCGRPLRNKKSVARRRGRACQEEFDRQPTLPALETVRVRDELL